MSGSGKRSSLARKFVNYDKKGLQDWALTEIVVLLPGPSVKNFLRA
jgi:hypothetical protein